MEAVLALVLCIYPLWLIIKNEIWYRKTKEEIKQLYDIY